MSVTQVGCTHAHTTAEAMNWLDAARAKIVFFDLMMISSLCHEGSEALLLDALPSLQIPVVFVQRNIDIPTGVTKMNAIICPPENLIQCLQHWISTNAS